VNPIVGFYLAEKGKISFPPTWNRTLIFGHPDCRLVFIPAELTRFKIKPLLLKIIIIFTAVETSNLTKPLFFSKLAVALMEGEVAGQKELHRKPPVPFYPP
jgi:hypothetical protein